MNVLHDVPILPLLLYAYVKKKLLAQLAAKGQSFKDKLRTFRDKNKEAAKKFKAKTIWA